MTADAKQLDVHQHLWPESLLEQLRRRTEPPMLRGWTLYTAGEAPFEVTAADHDPARRAALDPSLHRALVSLSTPLGIEALPPAEAQPLLDAWHDGALDLPEPFAPWASVSELDPDLDGLKGLLTSGFVGVQVSTSRLATRRPPIEAIAPLLSPVRVSWTGRCSCTPGRPARTPSTLRVSRIRLGGRSLVDYPGAAAGGLVGLATPPGAALLPTPARSASRPVPGWRRCTTSASPRAAAAASWSITTPSSTRSSLRPAGHRRAHPHARHRRRGAGQRPPLRPPGRPRTSLDLGAAAWHAISVVNPNRLHRRRTVSSKVHPA